MGDASQTQPGKLAQDGGLVQRFLHRRIAVAEPSLQQINPQHRDQRIGWSTIFILGVIRFDQGNQTLPRNHTIQLDQEHLFAGSACVCRLAKVICFMGTLGQWSSSILPNHVVFFRVSLDARSRHYIDMDHAGSGAAENLQVILTGCGWSNPCSGF